MTAIVETPVEVPTLSPEERESLGKVKDRLTVEPVERGFATVEEALADPADFERWIDLHHSTYLGVANRMNACPIQRYLTDTFRGRYDEFRVGTYISYRFPDDGYYRSNSLPMPVWAKHFITVVDSGTVTRVTKKRAREYLAKALALVESR